MKTVVKKLSKTQQNNLDSQYFTVKGILFRITGTKINSNGSYTHTIKNTTKKGFEAYKEIGAIELQKIIKR